MNFRASGWIKPSVPPITGRHCRLELFRETEIRDYGHSFGSDKNIAWLYVHVDRPLFVEVMHCGNNPFEYLNEILLRPSFFCQELLGVRDILHVIHYVPRVNMVAFSGRSLGKDLNEIPMGQSLQLEVSSINSFASSFCFPGDGQRFSARSTPKFLSTTIETIPPPPTPTGFVRS